MAKNILLTGEFMNNKIINAIKNDEFIVYLQSKHNILDSSIVGAEALVRWQHEDNLITPDRFIVLAEDLNIISNIDKFVFETLCKYINIRKRSHLPNIPFSCNASLQSLLNEDYLNHIKTCIRKYNISSNEVEIEITERSKFTEFEQVTNNIKSLRKLGIMFALDDFCNAYSVIKCLALPVNTLKIDGDFINKETHTYENKKIILKHLVNLANNLKLNIIAEGVENLSHIELLKSAGCLYAQGYYYGKPTYMKNFHNQYSKQLCKSYKTYNDYSV